MLFQLLKYWQHLVIAMRGSVSHFPIYVTVISKSLRKLLQNHGFLFPLLRLFNIALELNVSNEGEKKMERLRSDVKE